MGAPQGMGGRQVKPSTDGCTEWSCVYHGEENRLKAEHAEGCPVRAFTGFVSVAISDPEGFPEYAQCTCSQSHKRL